MTVKPDEQALWDRVGLGETPRVAGHELGIPPKRVQYLCTKWARKGSYDYGVSVDLGWPTEPGSDVPRRCNRLLVSGGKEVTVMHEGVTATVRVCGRDLPCSAVHL